MLSPCSCKGTVRYVHKDCLLVWISYRLQSRRETQHCELCGTKFMVLWRTKPFWLWKWKLHLTTEEKTKLNIFTFSYVVAAMGKTIICFIQHTDNQCVKKIH